MAKVVSEDIGAYYQRFPAIAAIVTASGENVKYLDRKVYGKG